MVSDIITVQNWGFWQLLKGQVGPPQISMEYEMRVGVSNVMPRSKKLCGTHQARGSLVSSCDCLTIN